jgi:class 3 adenylate cyclase
MPAELPEAAPQAATALIAHLRQHPDDAKRNPSELAEQFGLSSSFVRSVLASAGPPTKREKEHFHIVLDLSSARRVVKEGLARFDHASAEPMVFVAWTTLACVTFVAMLSLMSTGISTAIVTGEQIHTAGSALAIAAMVVTFLLHMTCYFRRGMLRYSLQGGLFVWVVMAMVFLVTFYQKHNVTFFYQLFIIGVTMVIGSIYAALGALTTILGGWARMTIEERHDEQMSRQELLERYFELQGRLENSGTTAGDEPYWSHWKLVRAFRRRPILLSVVVGVLASFPTAVLSALAAYQTTGIETPASFLFGLLRGTFVLIMFPVYIFIGFFSRGLREAFLNTVIGRLSALTTVVLPIALRLDPHFEWYLAYTLMLIPLALIAQVGAKMQSNLMRTESLRQNDQTAIVAEMLRIQWRLSDHRAVVCVLSVDAAKSSEMKAHADPLAMEYSFREYQDWIETTCEQFGGQVHSTAGDGAVVAFRDCASAFQAARRMQTDLVRFNREANRLPTPFRLRIGLHVGQVAGELNEVVFTEVIDIAAHVQASAPVSGIAVTDDVATELEQHEFIPLAKTVDGHGVSLALNPTED